MKSRRSKSIELGGSDRPPVSCCPASPSPFSVFQADETVGIYSELCINKNRYYFRGTNECSTARHNTNQHRGMEKGQTDEHGQQIK